MEVSDLITLRFVERAVVLFVALSAFLGGFFVVLRNSSRLNIELAKERLLIQGATPPLAVMAIGMALTGCLLFAPISITEKSESPAADSGPSKDVNFATGRATSTREVEYREAVRIASEMILRYSEPDPAKRDPSGLSQAIIGLARQNKGYSLAPEEAALVEDAMAKVEGLREFKVNGLKKRSR